MTTGDVRRLPDGRLMRVMHIAPTPRHDGRYAEVILWPYTGMTDTADVITRPLWAVQNYQRVSQS